MSDRGRASAGRFEELKLQLVERQTLTCDVISGSMEPLIHRGDRLRLEPSAAVPAPFDIIVYRDDHDRLVCHYVWRINALPDPAGRMIVITRGLANVWEDLPVPLDCILGRVVGVRIGHRLKWKIFGKLIAAAVTGRRSGA